MSFPLTIVRISHLQFICNQLQCNLKIQTFLMAFVITFFEPTLHFEHFEKKNEPIALAFLQLLTPKYVFT